jgi:glycosyltransferase involved in cell wall biosynthesis
MSNPTVSVILPVYNGEQYLRFAIESVLNQTFQDFELIIIDDGSVDSTSDIVREYGSRITYVRQNNTGVSGAFNHGLRLAAGRYISWLSHDDVFLPAKLEKQASELGRAGGPAVCYTDVQMIDTRGEVIRELRMPEYDRDEVLRHVLTGGTICTASYSVMYDRRCIEEVGVYSEYWKYTQDAEMLMRLARRFLLLHVPEVLAQVREHVGRGIRSKNWEREVVRFFREHLETIPIDELFPEAPERNECYQWLGDALAGQPYPIYRVAYTQYRRAFRERPSSLAQLLGRSAWLALRDAYEVLVRAVGSVPLLYGVARWVAGKLPLVTWRAIRPAVVRKIDRP